MMRKLFLMTAMVLPFSGVAFADDKADAMSRCLDAGKSQMNGQSMTPDQQKQMSDMMSSLCTCVIDKVGAMGDDGAKILRVLAKQTPEKMAESSDPAKDKANTIAILEAEYGMSEADAGAFYDRINPKVTEVSSSCATDAMKSMTPATPPTP